MIERLIEENAEKAFKFACRLTGDTQEAKELVQEAFFRVMRNWSAYNESQPFEHWFLTVLKHIHMDWQRNFERRNMVSIDAPLESGEGTYAETFSDGGEDMLDRLARQDSAGRVMWALERLPNQFRGILHLCDVQGLGYHEIAKVMDCSVGTVKSRVNRARTELRRRVLAKHPDMVEA